MHKKNKPIEWRIITEHPNYSVSSTGLVKGKRGMLTISTADAKRWGRVNFYLGDGKVKTYYVHRLVAAAFLPCDDMASSIPIHKNGDYANNQADNLEWVNAAVRRSERSRTLMIKFHADKNRRVE